jgi:hypothetical protein
LIEVSMSNLDGAHNGTWREGEGERERERERERMSSSYILYKKLYILYNRLYTYTIFYITYYMHLYKAKQPHITVLEAA